MLALLVATSVGMLAALAGTPILIRSLQVRGIGQQIREDGPEGHVTKAGTPTMGGVTMLGAAAAGYLASHIHSGAVFTKAGALVILVILGAGAVGLVDDWIKVRRQRSLGLDVATKMVGLVAVALVFAVLITTQAKARTDLSFARSLHVGLPEVVYVVWAVLVVVGAANSVNLADGLDGLAAGGGIFGFAAFVFIGFWEFRHPRLYHVGPALDLALVAAAMAGSCAGFLWWNAAPARIFMGDTGSLAIGAGLGALALSTNTHLLLPVIGGLFVIITMSVVIQVVAYKTLGRRVFRMAPVHHHFELLGWPETTVIVRFWILAGLCAALALGIFYADFVASGFKP